MSEVSLVAVRVQRCSRCGHRRRLVVATEAEVASRCQVCGDEVRAPRRAAPVGVAASATTRAAAEERSGRPAVGLPAG